MPLIWQFLHSKKLNSIPTADNSSMHFAKVKTPHWLIWLAFLIPFARLNNMQCFFPFFFFTKESILHFSFCVLHKQPLNHYKSMGDLQNWCWMFGCYSQQEFLAWQLVYKWIARIFHLGERIPNINHVKFFFWQWIDLIVIRHEPLLLRVSLLVVFFFPNLKHVRIHNKDGNRIEFGTKQAKSKPASTHTHPTSYSTQPMTGLWFEISNLSYDKYKLG